MVGTTYPRNRGIGVQVEVNPKLDKYIADAIYRHESTKPRNRMGIIADYDKTNNTATVIMSDQYSDKVGDIIKNVTCPTNIGIQMAAPEPGRACWVVFDGASQQNPYILSYANFNYNKYDFYNQNKAKHSIPTYLLDN